MPEDQIGVIIIEDDPLSAKQLSNWIKQESQFRLLDVVYTGAAAIEKIKQWQPGVIFSDIELPDMNAFQILEQLPPDQRPIVIFTTAHNEHAIRAFEVSALDYLLKPFDEERFQATVQKVLKAFHTQSATSTPTISQLLGMINNQQVWYDPLSDTLPIKSSGKISFVKYQDIHYVQASSYYIEVYSANKKHLLRESLVEFLKKLPSQFVRIHRSVIINLQYVQEIEKINQNDYQVRLKNQQAFRISKSYRAAFFEVCHLR